MKDFFHAQSVAVIGVSNSPNNMGRIMVKNLMEFGYQGYIHLVGPKGGAYLGHKIFSDVREIPERVDLATILVPAMAVPTVLRQCGEKGIRRVIVQSAGFRELGEGRIGLEKEIVEILKHFQMRMIGPNCIGIINRHIGLAVPFLPLKAESRPGRIGVVAQSGGVGAMMINSLNAENMGFSKFASIGNKLNVDESDLLEYLIQDEETDQIFCYLEGIADGRRLMEIASRSPKVIVAHKSNRGGAGAVIARSHSASLSSDDRVVDAAFRQCGILRTREQRSALEMLKAFSLPQLKGNRLAVISRSGGHAVMAADSAEEFGFQLPPFPPDLIQLAKKHSRAGVIQFHNPMDLGDLFNLPLYHTLAEQTLAREDIDGLLFIFNYQGLMNVEESRRLLTGLGDLMWKFQKPVAVCVFTTREELNLAGKIASYTFFGDPREAVRALALNRDRFKTGPLPFSRRRPAGVDRMRVQQLVEELPSGPVSPEKLAMILTAYGIPLVPWRKLEREEDVLAAAGSLGFPVVLKTAHPEVIHKSEAGGVYLNIADDVSLREAYRGLQKIGPSVLLQKMAEMGLEWLIGGRQDQTFGAVLVVGLGGIYVEVFKETSIRIAPIGQEEARRAIDECRGAALVGGVRGQAALDREALCDLIVRVSWLLYDFPEIEELDLNPVRLYEKGCLAVDWRARKK